MRLIINTTNMKIGGALQVSYSLLNEFKSFTGHEYHVFLSPQLNRIVNKHSFPSNFHFYHFNVNPTANIGIALTFNRKLSALERKIKPDYIFTVFGPALWKPQAPHFVGFANVVLFNKNRFTKETFDGIIDKVKFNIKRMLIMRQMRREANLIWVETDYAKHVLQPELKKHEKNFFVVSNTYSRHFDYTSTEFKPYSPGVNGPYKFIYLTAYYPHKNIEILNKVIPLLKQHKVNCQFHLSLPFNIFDEIFPNLNEDPMLINMGPTKPHEAPELYKNAHALFMPTLLEFFSASYPEAMKMKKPIITSDLEFAHSICGNAALYFDPYNPESIVEKIKQLINDQALQQDLVNKGEERLDYFESAHTRAEKILNIMQAHLQQ